MDISNIKEALSCSRCHKLPPDLIFLCSNGHSVCFNCKMLDSNCINCMVPIDMCRNLIAEEIISKISYKCEYCNLAISISEYDAHLNCCC